MVMRIKLIRIFRLRMGVALLALCAFAACAGDEPNVVVVLADDIGLGDISHYRRMNSDNIIVETPNLDKLAKQGMALTHAHSPAALCAPSRYAIMTGNHCYRSAYPWGVWGAYEESPIKPDQLTLGKLMKKAGYRTAFFGKWHIGGDWPRKDDLSTVYRGSRSKPELDVDITRQVGGGPEANGFTYSFMYPVGIQDVPYAAYENSFWFPYAEDSEIGYISQENMDRMGVKLDKSEGLGDLNWDPHKAGPLLASKAVEYIHKNAGKEEPIFLYYCSQAVHVPHTPPESLDGKPVRGSTPAKHLDMVKELDVQMGMIVKALKAKGIFENTLFIFTSDNGGLLRRESMRAGHRSSDIYRGGKNQIYEGGHRVPFIAHWPGKINPGSTSDEPVLGLDILATLASITGQDIPEGQAQDSKDILPILLGKAVRQGHSTLILQGGTGNEVAIYEDEWKLIIQWKKQNRTVEKPYPLALYNIMANPAEQESGNLIGSEEHADLIERLFEKYVDTRGSGVGTREW